MYSVTNTEDHIQSYFQHLKFCQIFSALSLKIVMTCLLFHLQQVNSQMLIFENSIPTERNKIKHKTPSTHCGPIFKLPKTEEPILFLNFKLSLNGGDLVFWFTFNLAVDFRPKMALTLEILSDQMHTLPRNSAEHTLFLFFASFRKSKSALCHLLCEKTCSLRTDKQLRNNVTSVDEYSTIVTV